MQIHYALCDPLEPRNGSSWTWASSEIPSNLLRWFESDYGGQHLPKGANGLPNPNGLTTDDLWGGLIRLEIPNFPDEHWTVAYRVLNGGNSEHNGSVRPQRYVIITAWMPTTETEGVDLLPILTSSIFQTIAENAEQHPIPSPSRLAENCSLPVVVNSFIEQVKPIATAAQKEMRTIVIQESIPPLPSLKKDFDDVEAATSFFANIPHHRIVLFPIQPFAWLKIELMEIHRQVTLQIEPNILPSKFDISKPKRIPTQQYPLLSPPVIKTSIGEFFDKLKYNGIVFLSGFMFAILLWVMWHILGD
jgi:hypothetical protein